MFNVRWHYSFLNQDLGTTVFWRNFFSYEGRRSKFLSSLDWDIIFRCCLLTWWMASIWKPASWKGSFATNRDCATSLSSVEHPSSPPNPLVSSLDFPIDFEAAQWSLSNPASQTKIRLVSQAERKRLYGQSSILLLLYTCDFGNMWVGSLFNCLLFGFIS